jgi:hypothetical protein
VEGKGGMIDVSPLALASNIILSRMLEQRHPCLFMDHPSQGSGMTLLIRRGFLDSLIWVRKAGMTSSLALSHVCTRSTRSKTGRF